ncbi:MAG: hypothetical protein IKU15_00005, partial [Clostridia bacterium]|nr:hypothetical protein [Clostridia bacterium]
MRNFVIKKKANTSTFDQLKTLAMSSGLFNSDDYNSLGVAEKQQYIMMLASNGKALNERLGKESIYSKWSELTANEKLSVINSMQALIVSEQQNIDATINQNLANDETIANEHSWAKWTTENKYDGDYSKFVSDYNDRGFDTLAQEGKFLNMPSETFGNLNSENAQKSIDYISSASEKYKQTASTQAQTSYQNLLTHIDYNIARRRREEAWNNASWWEKTGSTIAQLAALPVTEGANIIEGVYDAVVTGVTGVFEFFGADVSGARQFVETDTIALDTYLNEILPNSWATSEFSSEWNLGKIIYNFESSMIDMVPLALNIWVPGLGTAIYYTSSAGRTAEDFLLSNENMSVGSAVLYTAGATAIEFATEKISGLDFFGNTGWINNIKRLGSATGAGKFVSGVLGEALEEVIAEVGSGLLYGAFTNDYSRLNISNIAQAALLGGLMGGVMTGSNLIQTRRIVNNVELQLAKADGSVTKLSNKEIAIYQQYLTDKNTREQLKAEAKQRSETKRSKREAERVRKQNAKEAVRQAFEGKTLAEKLKMLFNGTIQAVKDGKVIAEGQGLTPDEISEKALQTLQEENATMEIDGTKSTVTVQELNNAADTATQNYQTATSLYLTQLSQQFGFDYLQASAEMFNDYSQNILNNLADRFDAIIKTDKSSIAVADKLAENFKGTEFKIVEHPELDNLKRFVATLNVQDINARRAGEATVFTFVSNKLETSPVIALEINNKPVIFVNAALFNDSAVQNIYKMVTAQLITYRISKSMSSNVLDIIDRYIERGNVTSISKEVQRQQLLQVMLFVQGNDLMQLVKWTSESDLDIIKSELSKYWSSLSLVTKNVAAQGMQTLDAAILEGVTEEQLNDVRDRLSEISEELPESELQQLHVKYSSQYHKANANAGRISFIADINYTTAQVALLVRYLQNHLNFDYDITGKSINQIARAVMDFNNYSDKGKALSQELQRFPVYRLSPDKSLANAPTVFSTKDSMNYFLAQLFDIQISDDYRIVALNEVEDMLIPEFYSDEDDLDFDMNVSDDAGKSRYKLSQFISKTARDRLGASFIDYDIYFVKRTTQAGTLGYTVNYSNQLGNTGGAIFVALLNDSRYIKEVLRHEIVHALANMSGLPDCLSSVVITVALESELAKAESLEEPGTLDDLITDLEQFLYRVQNVVWQGYDDAVTLGELFDKPAKYYLTTAKGRSTLADLMYVYFFANEANADSKRGYYTDSDDFRGTYLNSYLFSQVILTTQSQDPFLKRFNNATFRVKTLNNETLQRELNAYRKQAISKDAVIDSIIDVKPEFRSDTGKLGEDITVEDLKEFFGGKEVTDAQLQDRNFWIDNASSQRLREQLQACDNNYFAKLVEAYTGYMYNGEEALFEEPAYSKNELEKSYAKLFAKNEDYFAGLRNNKPRPINTELSKYVFGEYGDEFVGAIAYNADLGKATIQLDRLIMGQKTIAYIERIAETIGPQNMKYTVGSRVFNNFAAARRYRDTSEVNADSIRTSIPGDAQYANFDNIFTHLSNATTFSNLAELEYEGFRNANAIDTILVTNDGKGYGYNLEGNLFNKIVDICEQNNIPTDILMKHAVTPDGDLIANNEGLTNDVSKLFDSKRVVRLYKTGDGWQVFGKPNMLQDRFLKTFGIEPEGRYNPFVVEKSKVELIQDEHGRVTIAQKRKDGTFDGKRVGWANQKHYQLVCQLLTRYNITEFNQLYKLGFDEDFVKSIALYAGRGKRADHVLTNQGGLSTDTLIRYICDTTKSKASRNILINLLFPNNAHLQSVDDLDTYYKALESYRPLMLANNDSHVYSSIFELEQIYGAKIRAQQFTYNEKRAQAAQIAQTRFGAGSERKAERGLSYALYRMLQMDARQDIVSSPNGMDLSLSAFNTLASAYTQGFAEAPSKGEISIEGTQSSGRHADDNFQTDITDQVAAREAVTVETVWTSEWMTDFSTRVQEALRLPVPAKIKELTRLRDEYDSPDKPDTSDEFDLEMEDILYTYLDELVETGNNISPTGSKTFELSQAEKFIENFRAEIEEGQQKTGIDRQKFDDSMLGKYLDLRNNKQRYIAQYGKTVYDQMRQLLNQAGYSAGANVISNWQNKMSNDLTKYEKLYVDGKLSQKQYDTLQRGLDIYQDIWNSVNALTKISYSERINLQQTIYNSLKNFTAGQNERDVVQSIRGLLIEKARAGEIRFEPVEQAILAGVEAVYKNAGNEAYVAILREKIAEYDTPKYRNSLWAVISRLEKLLEDATAISIRPQARKSRRSLDLIELEVNDKLLSSAEDEGKTISGLNASVREAYNESVRQNLGKNPKVQGKTKGELTAEQKAKEERNKELWFLKNRQFLVERQIKRIEELSKSPEVSEIEIQNAIKEAYNTVMNFKFDNFKDILRSDASEYWKNNFKDLITRRKYLKKLSKDASLSDADKLEIADEIERINQRQKSEITKYIKKYEDFDRWRADALRAIKQQEFEKRITPDAEKAVIERQVNDYFASLKNILDHSSDYYTEEYKSKMHNHSKAIQDVAKFNSNLSALEKQKYISDLQAKFYRENQPEYTEEYHNAYNEYYGRMNEWLLGKGNKYAVYGRYGLNERRFQDLTVFDRQSERQAKILIGLRHALYSLYIAPKTKAAIDKFKADIQSVLSETRLNERIPGTNELVRIFANKDSSGELIVESEDVLDDLRTGKYIDLSLADYKISVNSTSGKITLASEAGKLTELD